MASDEQIKRLAVNIAMNANGYKPSKFLICASMAIASIIRKTLPKDKWKETVDGVTKSIQTILDGSGMSK